MHPSDGNIHNLHKGYFTRVSTQTCVLLQDIYIQAAILQAKEEVDYKTWDGNGMK